LDAVQQKLATSLADDANLLRKTQDLFSSNVTTIQANMEATENRLGKLGK
jgi:hypothetical protein